MPTIQDFDAELQAAIQAGLRGDLAAAIAGVERCRAARPDRVEPLVQLADLYPRVGRLDDADRVAGEALVLAPDDASVRLAVAAFTRYAGARPRRSTRCAARTSTPR